MEKEDNRLSEAEKLTQTDKKIAMNVSVFTIFVNMVLSFMKLFAGIFGHSGAMISDAIHSASDVFSTIIVMIGVNMSSKASDKDHPYGHDRLECVASIILAVALFATGAGIGIGGIQNIISGNYGNLQIPGKLALIAAVISIAVKEWMFWYTRSAAKKINSGALMADAWHHRSDALSSIGAFIGIFGARLGFPILDSVASVIICIFIGKVAYDIFKDSMDKMVDKSCDNETNQKIKDILDAQDGVIRVDLLQTRLFGSKIYVDVEIAADGDKTLRETHHIAEEIHRKIETQIPNVKHCMVHVNPYGEED